MFFEIQKKQNSTILIAFHSISLCSYICPMMLISSVITAVNLKLNFTFIIENKKSISTISTSSESDPLVQRY